MRPRAVPITIPDRPIYVRFDVAGHGEHVYRLPREEQAARLLDLALDGATLKLELHDPRVQVMEEAGGAAVGACWSHPTLELETEAPRDADRAMLLRWGAAVLEELYEAGYDLTSRASLVGRAVSMLMTHPGLADAREVAARLGFSAAPKDGHASGPSTSA